MNFKINQENKSSDENEMIFRVDTSDKDLNLCVKGSDGRWKTLLWIDHYDLGLRVCDSLTDRVTIEIEQNTKYHTRKNRWANLHE